MVSDDENGGSGVGAGGKGGVRGEVGIESSPSRGGGVEDFSVGLKGEVCDACGGCEGEGGEEIAGGIEVGESVAGLAGDLGEVSAEEEGTVGEFDDGGGCGVDAGIEAEAVERAGCFKRERLAVWEVMLPRPLVTVTV